MMTVEFLFDVDELVTIATLKDKGIVTAVSRDSARQNQYYVQTASGGQWWTEKFLTAGAPKRTAGKAPAARKPKK